MLPKMLGRVPKDSEVNLVALALKGVLGVPNWCWGLAASPNRLPERLTSGVSRFTVRSPSAGGNDWRFEGVSGMT